MGQQPSNRLVAALHLGTQTDARLATFGDSIAVDVGDGDWRITIHGAAEGMRHLAGVLLHAARVAEAGQATAAASSGASPRAAARHESTSRTHCARRRA